MKPKYPVYVISKSRWDSRLTSKALEFLDIPYHIVIEPQELEQYANVIDRDKILVLPFSNLGEGSIPARNWVWEHSIGIGAKSHWIMDDNIRDFYRLNNNRKYRTKSAGIFRAAEDFVDRYKNVVKSGFNYDYFCLNNEKYPPYYVNTRIYSCILLRNDIPHRWRGRYNEDTDLSIRILKDGYCTILFNAFLAGKTPTLTMKGGNSDELYKQDDEMDGRLLMAQSLVDQHPEIVRVVHKWGRYQHSVDYSSFKKNRLVRSADTSGLPKIDNYKMKLIYMENENDNTGAISDAV
tara:strand:- start:351 stop:1229 length:879 start_codon:yes stop_codon:yes gene_type:complete